jgi:hypothetical protein
MEKWRPANDGNDSGRSPAREEPAYEYKDVYEFLESTLRTSQGRYGLLLTYTEIAAVLRIGRSCTWTIGAGKTKDDNAYEITVEAGKWSSKKLSGLELILVKRDSISRILPAGGDMPAEPLVVLGKPQLRVDTGAKGEQILVGSIPCTRHGNKWVEHLTLWMACKSEKNELPIVVFDANEPPRSGNIEINYKPRSPVNFEAGGRIYLEAFLCRPKAGLYRISNEVVWPGAAGKND